MNKETKGFAVTEKFVGNKQQFALLLNDLAEDVLVYKCFAGGFLDFLNEVGKTKEHKDSGCVEVCKLQMAVIDMNEQEIQKKYETLLDCIKIWSHAWNDDVFAQNIACWVSCSKTVFDANVKRFRYNINIWEATKQTADTESAQNEMMPAIMLRLCYQQLAFYDAPQLVDTRTWISSVQSALEESLKESQEHLTKILRTKRGIKD